MDSRVIPSLDLQHYIDLCYEYAQFSTCAKARYGSVIVMADENMPYGMQHVGSDGSGERILGTGCNHSPNPACTDCATLCAGKLRLGVKSGTRVELCYAVHAEQWALLEAGPLAKGATLFNAGYDSNWEKTLRKDPTLPPGHPNAGFYCSVCARLMWAAGIKYVVRDTVWGIPIVYTMEDVWASSYAVADSI